MGLDKCGNSCPPPGFDPRNVQPVASRYPGPHCWCYIYNEGSYDKRFSQTHKNCMLTVCIISRSVVAVVSVFTVLFVYCIAETWQKNLLYHEAGVIP